MRYTNIFTEGQSTGHEPGVFDCDRIVARSACGRGVIIKWHARVYHYLVDGRLVTMRAGGSREMLERITGYITRGEQAGQGEAACFDLRRCMDWYRAPGHLADNGATTDVESKRASA